MSKFAEVAQKLQDVSSEVSDLRTKLAAKEEEHKTVLEDYKKEGVAVGLTFPESSKPTVKGAKRGPRPGTKRVKKDAPAAGDGTAVPKKPSLKEVVLDILKVNPDGLILKQLVEEVDKLIAEGKYETTATKRSAVVSQAVNKLKEENLIQRNTENHRWSLAG